MVPWYAGSPSYSGTLVSWPLAPWWCPGTLGPVPARVPEGTSELGGRVVRYHGTSWAHARTMQGEQPITRHPEDLNHLPDMVRFLSFDNLLRQLDFGGKCCTPVFLFPDTIRGLEAWKARISQKHLRMTTHTKAAPAPRGRCRPWCVDRTRPG